MIRMNIFNWPDETFIDRNHANQIANGSLESFDLAFEYRRRMNNKEKESKDANLLNDLDVGDVLSVNYANLHLQ